MNIKRLIKRLLIRSYGFLKKDCKGKVIYYHDISKKYTNQGTPLNLFIKQMNILKESGYKVVPNLPSSDNEIMICFDDGWKGLWDNRQYFIDNNIFPTVFLIVDYIGKDGYLSKNEILELQSCGFKFQGHTFSHKNVTEVTGDDLNHELIYSRIELSKILGKTVNEFCFPRGEYSDTLVDIALSNGYDRVFICTPGNVNANTSIINRNLVQDCPPIEFKAILKGGLELFSKSAEKLHHK